MLLLKPLHWLAVAKATTMGLPKLLHHNAIAQSCGITMLLPKLLHHHAVTEATSPPCCHWSHFTTMLLHKPLHHHAFAVANMVNSYLYGRWLLWYFCHCPAFASCTAVFAVATGWLSFVICCLSFVIVIDKNHTGINDCCVSSWFCSHPVGPNPWDQEQMTDPYQDRPLLHLTITQWHHSSSSSSYLTNDSSHLQTKPSHITPQEPHHHCELFKRSPVGFLLKSTGNQPRSWVQD